MTDRRKVQTDQNPSSSETRSVTEINSSGNNSTGKQKTSTQSSRSERVTLEASQEVIELKKRDSEVKTHEQAHIAAGGQYVRGGARYEHTVGPDGKQYATGGEVSIDTSPVPGDPQATMKKMEVVKRAALAPAQPSSQDYGVADKATSAAGRARQQLMKKSLEDLNAPKGGSPASKGQNVDMLV